MSELRQCPTCPHPLDDHGQLGCLYEFSQPSRHTCECDNNREKALETQLSELRGSRDEEINSNHELRHANAVLRAENERLRKTYDIAHAALYRIFDAAPDHSTIEDLANAALTAIEELIAAELKNALERSK